MMSAQPPSRSSCCCAFWRFAFAARCFAFLERFRRGSRGWVAGVPTSLNARLRVASTTMGVAPSSCSSPCTSQSSGSLDVALHELGRRAADDMPKKNRALGFKKRLCTIAECSLARSLYDSVSASTLFRLPTRRSRWLELDGSHRLQSLRENSPRGAFGLKRSSGGIFFGLTFHTRTSWRRSGSSECSTLLELALIQRERPQVLSDTAWSSMKATREWKRKR